MITLSIFFAVGLNSNWSLAAGSPEDSSRPDAATAKSTTAEKTSARDSKPDDVTLLKRQLAEQQDQIEQLRRTLSEQKALLDKLAGSETKVQPAANASSSAAPEARPADLGQVASTAPVIPAAVKTSTVAAATAPLPGMAGPAPATPQVESKSAVAQSPLTLTIGDADFTIGGFLDATAFYRSTDLGSGIGSSFGSVPFSNSVGGQLSETRFSAQNSRVTLMATSMVHDSAVKGYIEADFLGTQPTNAFVTSNSQTMRLRLYWIQVVHGKFEFLAGQSWSLLNPGRNGMSPMPGDIFYSQDMDTNYQVGLTWSRNNQFRFIYHPSKVWALGLSLENPEQFVGNVTLPPNFPTAEVDQGANTATPNVFPDVVAKITADPMVGGKHEHIEVAGVMSNFRTIDPTLTTKTTATGGGGSVNFNLEVAKNFHFILNTFYSDGGGRWIFGLGPDFIIKQDGTPSLVHASSAITGFEYQVNPNTLLYTYYGGAYYQRNTAIYVDPKTGKASLMGFGYTGSPSSQNKSIQEPTFGLVQTFWQNPRYGKLQLITQYSYVTRSPWFVAPGTPKNAHLSMGYVDIRYVLP
ncbi:MAG TPA: hypothetical protein VKU44_05425 [Terriglobia bacterium]|nr:hypothetical protein [Terriglobia bacterium]